MKRLALRNLLALCGLFAATSGPAQAWVERAAKVAPHPRQIAWQQLEFYAFVHFGVNTFTDREWGTGTEDPKIFHPTALDARQWVSVFKDAGMRMVILTAKHHDGFCLWPSRYTEHSVKNSPWRGGAGDVVREVADACREAGLKFGVYLSPADLNAPSYGDTEGYNTYFKNQLRELLTQYGDITEVWFDGANPRKEGMKYDYFGWYRLIRELQPNAVIFGMGPDVRWVGNEGAHTRAAEWSVFPSPVPLEQFHGGDSTAEDLGSRAKIASAPHLLWWPAETDVSIRPGWFYHAAEDAKVKSVETLLDMYYRNVGGNCTLLLNVPPDRRGLIHENDAAHLRQLGKVLQSTFQVNLADAAKVQASHQRPEAPASAITDANPATFWTTPDGQETAELTFELAGRRTFNRAQLMEHLPVGQRIEGCALDVWIDGSWKEVATATTVGYMRLLRFPEVTTDRVRIRITGARWAPTLSKLGLFREATAPRP
ncbi:MAG: alpha-L-fucosidase [Verrucomicrobiales bacterium]|nr:alpha-L-fucosidase [Verrucomicrobiales bacterium]